MELKFINICWRGGRAHGRCAVVLASLRTSPLAALPQFPHPEKVPNGFMRSGDVCEVGALQGDWLEGLKASPPSVLISFLAGLGPSRALGWTSSRVCSQERLFLTEEGVGCSKTPS